MPRKTKATTTRQTIKAPAKKSYLERIEEEVSTNQSKLNLILGALIILVVGVLLFNYFTKSKSGQIETQKAESSQQGDVNPESLPGKYTVKEGDTLFTIAEKYYSDGFKYPEIVNANSLENPNNVETGLVLEIPKLAQAITPTTQPSVSTTPTITGAAPTETPTEKSEVSKTEDLGPKITDDKYTVVEGDWLSTIAGRAYGDIYAFDKIAKANNIQDPNYIEAGVVLTIPR